MGQEQRAFREAGHLQSLGEGSELAPLNRGASREVWEVKLQGWVVGGCRARTASSREALIPE